MNRASSCASTEITQPLHQACHKNGNLEMVKYLVEKQGCDINMKDVDGNTPLNLAACTGNLDILIYLIEEKKCRPGCPGRWGRSPLHNACQKNGNLEMVKYLVEKQGCDVNQMDQNNITPLDLATTCHNGAVMKYFEERMGISHHINHVCND